MHMNEEPRGDAKTARVLNAHAGTLVPARQAKAAA